MHAISRPFKKRTKKREFRSHIDSIAGKIYEMVYSFYSLSKSLGLNLFKVSSTMKFYHVHVAYLWRAGKSVLKRCEKFSSSSFFGFVNLK